MGWLGLLLNWIHLKIIIAATFRITDSTKIAKIEFLPLDWIYHSIRIITVLFLVNEYLLFHLLPDSATYIRLCLRAATELLRQKAFILQ